MTGTLYYMPLSHSWFVAYGGVFGNSSSLRVHPETNPINFEEHQEVEFEIETYGLDPYDNQFPGIDYYDVAKIIKKNKPKKKPTPWNEVLKNHTNGLIRGENGNYVELLRWLEENYKPPIKK